MSLAAHITTTVGTVTIDAELTCQAGETVALLGPNGAGKSTLLTAIAGLRAIDDGYIRIDSTSVDEPAQAIFLPPEHRRVGVLFQDYLLFPHMTVRQNIAFGPKNLGIASEGEWIAALGLTDLLDHKPNELSGGQAQRVALARALSTSPRLLLLDDPWPHSTRPRSKGCVPNYAIFCSSSSTALSSSPTTRWTHSYSRIASSSSKTAASPRRDLRRSSLVSPAPNTSRRFWG